MNKLILVGLVLVLSACSDGNNTGGGQVKAPETKVLPPAPTPPMPDCNGNCLNHTLSSPNLDTRTISEDGSVVFYRDYFNPNQIWYRGLKIGPAKYDGEDYAQPIVSGHLSYFAYTGQEIDARKYIEEFGKKNGNREQLYFREIFLKDSHSVTCDNLGESGIKISIPSVLPLFHELYPVTVTAKGADLIKKLAVRYQSEETAIKCTGIVTFKGMSADKETQGTEQMTVEVWAPKNREIGGSFGLIKTGYSKSNQPKKVALELDSNNAPIFSITEVLEGGSLYMTANFISRDLEPSGQLKSVRIALIDLESAEILSPWQSILENETSTQSEFFGMNIFFDHLNLQNVHAHLNHLGIAFMVNSSATKASPVIDHIADLGQYCEAFPGNFANTYLTHGGCN